MRISYLREFVELAYRLNFSLAARMLNTTQSTLSKHVLALEKECGADLFARSGAQMRLTQEGQALFEGALEIIASHDATLDRIASLKKTPPIKVGGLYRNLHVMRFLDAIAARKKGCEPPLAIGYSDAHHRPFVEQVEKGELDVAFTILERNAVLPAGLEVLHLFDDPLVAIVTEGHPLAERDEVALEDIDGRVMLAPDGTYAIAGATLVRGLFASRGVRPLYRPVFLQAVQDFPTLDITDSILVVERSILQQQPLGGAYRVLPFVEEDACFPFYAVFRADAQDAALQRFVKALKDEAKKGV